MIKKMVIVGAIGTILVASFIINNINTKAQAKKRLEIVNNYIKCLDDNFGQRDYCARLQGIPYQIIDQYSKEFGYNFTIDKYGNLLITKEAK